jgi:hypothetical protein
MDNSLPGKIPDVDSSAPTPPVGEKVSERQPGLSFQKYMETPPSAPSEQGIAPTEQAPSPYQLQQGQVSSLGTPSMDSLQMQSSQLQNNLDTVNTQLNTKNLTLNQSQKYLLRNKLSESNDSLRTAASKAGAEVNPPITTSNKLNPVAKFLAYVTDSQMQLASVQKKLKQLSADGKSLSAGEMLMIQVKLNKAQQAIEYSSTLLGKAVEDIKTLFNVQI